jgi:zinc protease
MAAAFTAHPYGWPVVGWMVDIQNWKREDLIQYYRTYYAPNNCVIVAVGDFSTDVMVKSVRELFETIPTVDMPPPVTTAEPEQRGERRIVLNKTAQVPLLQISYHGPSAGDPDFLPMRVLDYLLLHGESSRLYNRLVDKEQLAVSVTGGHSPHIDPFPFKLALQPRSGVQVSKLEQVLYQELEKVQTTPVPERELQKAKNTAVVDFYRSIKTINDKAHVLGIYEVLFGDYRKLFQTAKLIGEVKQEDVRRVARKYFLASNRTVAILVPENEKVTEGGRR